MAQKNKRREADVMKLMMSEFQLELVDDKIDEFYIWFSGPKDSPYEGGVWKVHVELPEQYPYKSPSIGFVDRIYHPNVDETAGSVCLDVINQTWSPMFDLINVFEVFLPQLLLYPNPTDPLNGEAAALLMREPDAYNKKVKEYVGKYAQKQKGRQTEDTNSDSNSSKSVGEQEEQMDIEGGDLENSSPPTLHSHPVQDIEMMDDSCKSEKEDTDQAIKSENEINMEAEFEDDAQSEGSFLSNASDEEEEEEDDRNHAL